MSSFPFLPITRHIAVKTLQLLKDHTETPYREGIREDRDRRYKIYFSETDCRLQYDELGSLFLLNLHYAISPAHALSLFQEISEIKRFPVILVDTFIDMMQQKEAS